MKAVEESGGGKFAFREKGGKVLATGDGKHAPTDTDCIFITLMGVCFICSGFGRTPCLERLPFRFRPLAVIWLPVAKRTPFFFLLLPLK